MPTMLNIFLLVTNFTVEFVVVVVVNQFFIICCRNTVETHCVAVEVKNGKQVAFCQSTVCASFSEHNSS